MARRTGRIESLTRAVHSSQRLKTLGIGFAEAERIAGWAILCDASARERIPVMALRFTFVQGHSGLADGFSRILSTWKAVGPETLAIFDAIGRDLQIETLAHGQRPRHFAVCVQHGARSATIRAAVKSWLSDPERINDARKALRSYLQDAGSEAP